MLARHERKGRGFATIAATDERSISSRIPTRCRPSSSSGRRTPSRLLLRGLEAQPTRRKTTATATTPSSMFMFMFFVVVVMISLIHIYSTTTTSGVAAAAFLVLRMGHDRRHRRGTPPFSLPSSAAVAPPTTGLFATVYAPPWEGGEHQQAEHDYDDNGKPYRRRSTTSAALEALLGGHESAALLARLAVAFSPTGRSLGLRDIEHVHVLALDHQHLDIQAVVCEEDGCVTLKVPVNFPTPCLVGDDDDDDDDQCVWDNLRVLDEQAQETIRELEWRDANHEDVAAQHRLHLELMQPPTDEGQWWPEWWVHHQPMSSRDDAATSTLLRRECDSIRKLLNDDEFRSAVVGMASLALGAADNDSMYDDYQVELAAVASVCPSGLLLRASVRPIEILGTSCTGAGAHKVLEIPVRFQGAAIATTPDELQSAVLALVAAAEGYSD